MCHTHECSVHIAFVVQCMGMVQSAIREKWQNGRLLHLWGRCPRARVVLRVVVVHVVLREGSTLRGAEFRVLFIVEEGDVSEHFELLYHVLPVDVQAVDVLDESGYVLCHRREFCAWEVVFVHRDACYHRELSRSVCC